MKDLGEFKQHIDKRFDGLEELVRGNRDEEVQRLTKLEQSDSYQNVGLASLWTILIGTIVAWLGGWLGK